MNNIVHFNRAILKCFTKILLFYLLFFGFWSPISVSTAMSFVNKEQQQHRIGYFPIAQWISDRWGEEVDPATVLGATDETFQYFGLDDWYLNDYYSWGDNDPRNGINGVTVAVIDTGLRRQDWIDLENSVPYVNIVAYVTALDSFNSQPTVFTSPYQSGFPEPPDDRDYDQHGVAVVSALGAVAKAVNVVFIDMLWRSDNSGFRNLYDALGWIYDHHSEYNIRVVTTSLSWSMSEYQTFSCPVPAYCSNTLAYYSHLLYEENIPLIVAVGNSGYQYNYNVTDGRYYFIPQNTLEWFIVSSIDYEDIGNIVDHDRYSVKDHWTGSAVASPYAASWGDETRTNYSVDWSMPGNQVPAMSANPHDRDPSTNERKWYYQCGTSFSAPYFAGIIAIVIDGYRDGYLAFGKTAPVLTIDKLKQILLEASSLTAYNYKLGYGFVDAHLAYRGAYNRGYSEAFDGGGGPGPHPI